MLDQLRDQWLPRFSHLPEPRWAVLLGGDSGPFVFTAARARRLACWLNERVAEAGGSVLATDSARTPAGVYEEFLNALNVPVHAYRWGSKEENPYRGYLAIADQLVVTGESMSMLAEAAVANRPMYIFDLSDNPIDEGEGRRRPWWVIPHNFRYRPLTHRLAMWLAPRRMRRDVTRIQARLVADGTAAWAGQDAVAEAGEPGGKGLDDAVYAVKRIFYRDGEER